MITSGFFEKREKKLDEYRANGYLELEDVLQQTGINIEQLIKAGLLKMKEIQSTADLLDYQVTEKGRAYFKELKRMQLIVVSKKNQQALIELRIML